jgi:hypothetical protein
LLFIYARLWLLCLLWLVKMHLRLLLLLDLLLLLLLPPRLSIALMARWSCHRLSTFTHTISLLLQLLDIMIMMTALLLLLVVVMVQ